MTPNEIVYIRKEFNSHRIALVHQHGRRSSFWKTNRELNWSDARQPEVRCFSSYKHASDIKFVFLSFFTVIKAIWLKICAKPPSKNEKRPLPVDVRRSKTSLLKLPIMAAVTLACVAGAWKEPAQERTGRERARAPRSFLRPLLPSGRLLWRNVKTFYYPKAFSVALDQIRMRHRAQTTRFSIFDWPLSY